MRLLLSLGGPAFLDSLELPTLIDRHRDLLGRVFLFNGSLADRKGSDQVTTGKSTSSSNTKKNKRRQKKSAAMTSAVQRVFETCKEVFADGGPGIVPSPDEVERLRSVLGTTICYGRIFLSFFLLPFLTLDTLRWRVWLDRKEKILVNARASLAKLHTDAISVAPCETSVLYPAAGGNLHCFTAVTSCAVLDVLGPPYDEEEGRACTYYRGNAYSNLPVIGSDRRCVFGFSCSYAWLLVSGDGLPRRGEREEYYAWLEERGSEPDELVVRGAEYKGPRIVDH
ncbi:hypothetical protein GW17_00045147 [Ensete ventricosum]|nr:hypothetical protein GW17_00045147 [Ensete ventricosum]